MSIALWLLDVYSRRASAKRRVSSMWQKCPKMLWCNVKNCYDPCVIHHKVSFLSKLLWLSSKQVLIAKSKHAPLFVTCVVYYIPLLVVVDVASWPLMLHWTLVDLPAFRKHKVLYLHSHKKCIVTRELQVSPSHLIAAVYEPAPLPWPALSQPPAQWISKMNG